MLNNNFEFKFNNVNKDDNGNLLVLDIEIGDFRLSLVNLYGPNNDQPNFMIMFLIFFVI